MTTATAPVAAADPVDPPAADPAIIIPADPPAGDPPPADPVAANDDWRTQFATDDKGEADETLTKFLGRYHSPQAAIKAWKQYNDDATNGKLVRPLGEEPSEDEVKSFRKDFGIPEEPAGYLEKLPEGLVIGDDDKPMVDKFLSAMHTANVPPQGVNAALGAYYQLVQEQADSQVEADQSAMNDGIEALREEWGKDYKPNLNAAHAYLGKLPASVQTIFRHGRVPVLDAEGNPTDQSAPIGYNSDALKFLAGLALEENPAATLVPGAGSNQVQAISDELADIEKMMGDRSSDYWKGPKSEGMQARYRQLVEGKQKLAARG